MPRDNRLYMTFPNDFWMHAKIRPLSDKAFRAFVEINGLSRMQDLDGRVPVALARATWPKRALDELCANHPERPSLTLEDGFYVIWNYDQHQQTRADREATAEQNRINGSKGGRPPKPKPTETEPVSGSVAERQANRKPKKPRVRDQRSEILTSDTSYDSSVSYVGDVGGSSGLTDLVVQRANREGIADVADLQRTVRKATGFDLSFPAVIELAVETAKRARRQPVADKAAYLATACRRSADDVAFDIDRLDLEVA